ncbi:MAG: Holliday junction branch migration protein RuvA, partial [Endomicrobium sp.]|nr:Holliday junction branch migration protein RuvA [Endomicrobium sp.]
MIDYLCGTLNSKSTNSVTVDVNGIGYSVAITMSSFSKLPEIGNSVKIYVAEAVAGIYGGVVYLYGFLSKEEREMYLLIKDEVPGTGAKKAMEHVDKISKSFADFKTAVITKNPSMLNGIFGFTKKTADKLIAALKDKIAAVNITGQEKWSGIKINENSMLSDAIEGLIALGYKEQQARVAVTKTYE